MTEQAVTPADLERQIIARALKDPRFYDELVANPREALAALGVQLPADVRVKVVWQEPNSLYLVLPARSAAIDAADELSEAELANIVGAPSGNQCPRA